MNQQTSISTLSAVSFLPKIEFLQKGFRHLILAMILCLILPLLVFYVFQVGMITKGNYLVKNYTQELKKLSLANEMLGVETAKNLSLENVEKEIEKLNFVSVSEIKYIPVSYDYLVKTSVQNYKAKTQ